MDEETSTLEAVFLGKVRAALDNLFERTRAKDELTPAADAKQLK
ncbi:MULTISPECIES: hypothetical protein [Rhodanobacter]|nr:MULTISPECIES: hypothetical protein [Rhodanobacter]